MAYRPNFGGNYDNYPSNNLGYSNVSRGFNKNSFRSNLPSTQMPSKIMEDSDKSSSCSKTNAISSGRPKTNLKQTLTTRENEG